MGVYIKNMDMPKNCFECPWRCKVDPENLLCRISGEYFEETFSGTIQNRHKSCPLIELQPHGRLIDADVLEVHDGWMNEDRERNVQQTHITFVYSNDIANAPTIIPADPAEEGE